MKKTSKFIFFSLLSCVICSSCHDEQIDILLEKEQINENKTRELIEFAKEQYFEKKPSTTKSLTLDEPQWSNYKTIKQTNDTLAISIPISNYSSEKTSVLVATKTNSIKNLYLINLPNEEVNNLPQNIQRRLIVNTNGKLSTCRFIRDKKGHLRLVRVRDVIMTKSNPINGGMIPEVVIHPGWIPGLGEYNANWWWWDYMGGLISTPPPGDHLGIPGHNQDDNFQSRPNYYKAENIMNDASVKTSMKAMFKNVKNDASNLTGRRERGFWVYYDAKSQKYYVGNEKSGQYVKGGTGTNGSVSPGNPLPRNNGDHIPATAVPVTFVHTHTPLTYEGDCRREVGFSQSDIDYANANNIEIILIDYIGTFEEGRYYIYGGHDIDAPTKEYIYTPTK